MLPGKLYRRALKQAKFVLTRQLAEGDHRTRERDRANGRTEEQLQTVARRDGVAQMANDTQ